MIKATRRMSSATHAPCVHEVMTGITRIAPDKNLILRTHCNAEDSDGWLCYEYLHWRGTTHSRFLVTAAWNSPCARRAEISSPSLRPLTSFNNRPWESNTRVYPRSRMASGDSDSSA